MTMLNYSGLHFGPPYTMRKPEFYHDFAQQFECCANAVNREVIIFVLLCFRLSQYFNRVVVIQQTDHRHRKQLFMSSFICLQW